MSREKHPSLHNPKIQEALLTSRNKLMLAAFKTIGELNEFRRQLYACRRAHKIHKTLEHLSLEPFISRRHDTKEMKQLRKDYDIDHHIYPETLVFTAKPIEERAKVKPLKPVLKKKPSEKPKPLEELEEASTAPDLDLLDIISSLSNEDIIEEDLN